MQDARISTALPSHPKTKKLARRLGAAGPLGCIYLFLWAAANRSDGDLTGLTGEDIELAVDWAGDDGAFVAEMVAVGFLDGAEGSYTIHDWADHNPWAAGAEARSQRARFASLCRDYGRERAIKMMPEYAVGDTVATPKASPADSKPASIGHPPATVTASDGHLLDDLVDADGSSPLPSPSPSPSPKKEQQKPARALPAADLLPGIPDSVVRDFTAIRKAKRAPLTETAVAGIVREADKAGMSLQAALEMCCARGWSGFNAEWLDGKVSNVVALTAEKPGGGRRAL